MDNHFGRDLTTGSITKNLIQFALPMLIGNLLSTGYSVINIMWVGNLIGKDAVGAVAVSFPIFLGMVALCSGATLATSVLISQAYGAKNHIRIQRIVNNSWTIGIIIILIVSVSGLFFCKDILRLLKTPSEIMSIATGYLQIAFINFAGLYLSYLISSILRGVGDTVIPMICIIVSTAVNAVLDPLLILGIGPFPKLGLNGSAYSDLIATTVTIALGIFYTTRKYKNEPVNPSGLLFEKDTVMKILKIGLPSFVQQMLISIGYAFITVFVNRFDPASIAAYGIVSKIDAIAAMPAMALMMAASALTAQNIGAGKPERIKDILKFGILVNIPVILMISALCVTFPQGIMRAFVKEPDVIQVGVDYLRIVGAGYLFFTVFYVSNGIINGAGKTIPTMFLSFISLCLIRVPLAGLLSRTKLGIHGIWIAIVISFAASTINSLVYYNYGKWRKEISSVAHINPN
ncbi:MAG: MATE family efflux transporter [Lachnospiraceae bacterium]|nr:MATE family efflux transporter [Lachnospiraceae bacterium]